MKVNETILNDLQALSKKEFMTKYQIPKSTYYYWKKKYGSNTTANKIKNEEHKDEEISEGIVENTQPIQNEEIIDLDLGENVENKVNNDVDLVATLCKTIYPLAVQVIEKILRKKYKGNLQKFLDKVIPLWKKKIDQWGINLSSFDDIFLVLLHVELFLDMEDIREENTTEKKLENNIPTQEIHDNDSKIKYNVDEFLEVFTR